MQALEVLSGSVTFLLWFILVSIISQTQGLSEAWSVMEKGPQYSPYTLAQGRVEQAAVHALYSQSIWPMSHVWSVTSFLPVIN